MALRIDTIFSHSVFQQVMDAAIAFRNEWALSGLLGVAATSLGLILYLRRGPCYNNRMKRNASTSSVSSVSSEESYSYDDGLSGSNLSVFEYDSLGSSDTDCDVIPSNTVTHRRQNLESDTYLAVPTPSAATAAGNRMSPRRRIRYTNVGVHRPPLVNKKMSGLEEKPQGDFVFSANNRSSEKSLLHPSSNVRKRAGEKEVLLTTTSSRIKQMDSDTAIKILRDLGTDEEPSKDAIQLFHNWLATPSDLLASSLLVTSSPLVNASLVTSSALVTSSTSGMPSGDKVIELLKVDSGAGLNVFISWYREIWGQTYCPGYKQRGIVHRSSHFLQRLLSSDEENHPDKMDVFHKWLAAPSGGEKAVDDGLNIFVNWYRDVNSAEGADDFKTLSVLQKGSYPFLRELYLDSQHKKKKAVVRNVESVTSPRSVVTVNDAHSHQADSPGSATRKRQRVNKKQRDENTHQRNSS
ncbi:uncharacterized protein LOC121377113 [Gigantopelta aegis]|uniref:uncharacterized protein LOC121377113 n=1 Tax=Gigantopelta aegis TaxID=1735272 RepID=UPI001B88B50F|nr:uncharacterized protein LOC121377113 [Gigantopelta aegis]